MLKKMIAAFLAISLTLPQFTPVKINAEVSKDEVQEPSEENSISMEPFEQEEPQIKETSDSSETEFEGDFQFEVVDGFAVLKKANPNLAGDIIIPDFYDGSLVTKIGTDAFRGCQNVLTIRVPSGVTRIDSRAFSGCSALTDIDLPVGLESIGDMAFINCISLQSLEIPDGVSIIPSSLCEGCTALQSVDLPDSATKINDEAFAGCSSLIRVDIPEGIKEIGESAFSWDSSIIEITLPESLKTIRRSAFHNTGISRIVIPDSVDTLEGYVFHDCRDLEEAQLPKSLTVINPCLFDGCSKLKAINIPNTVRAIGQDAFSSSGLTTLSIPEGVERIDFRAFMWCHQLTSVSFPSSLRTIGSKAFKDCGALETLQFSEGLETISDAFSHCTGLTEIELPNSLTTLGQDAFSSCSELKTVVFGDNLESIPNYCFRFCSKLGEINLPLHLKRIGSRAFEGCELLDVSYFPNGLEEIMEGAFSNSGIKSAILPDSLQVLDEYAFNDCTKLTEISLPKSMTRIEPLVFQNCKALQNFELPSNLQSIGHGAFSYCTSITNVTLPLTLTLLEDYAFSDCSNLQFINLPESISAIPDGLFRNCKKLISIDIPEQVTYIGEDAFKNCVLFEEIILPPNLEVLGGLEGCIGLTSIDIPESVSELKDYTFRGTNFITVKLPDNITVIPSGAFAECHELLSVQLPKNLTMIEKSAFYDCSKLPSIDLPDTLTSLGEEGHGIFIDITNYEGAFEDCTSLTSIEIPGSVATIGIEAFIGCSALRKVVLHEGVERVEYAAFRACPNLDELQLPTSLIEIGSTNFPNTRNKSRIEKVTYNGNSDEWDNVIIDDFQNDRLLNSKIYCIASKGYARPNSIINLVAQYTSDDLYAQYKDIDESSLSYESKYKKWQELFNQYGITNVKEGIQYLSTTNDKRHAYLTLTTNGVYCASLFKHDLNNTAKGLLMRPVLYASGLVFNGEIGEYIDVTHLVDGEYPGVKKYKSMLYDFMDFQATKIQAQEYIRNVTKITKNSTKLAKADANRLIDHLNGCANQTELAEVIASNEMQGVFATIKNEDGKVSFTLDSDSGFGRFARDVGTSTRAIGIADMLVSNFGSFLELDAKLKVYEQYKDFLETIANDTTHIPGDLAAAARLVLAEIEEGYMGQIESFCLDILNEIKINNTSVNDLVLDTCLTKLGLSGASKVLGTWLGAINLEAFFINQIANVGDMIKKESYVEGYAFIADLYSDKLEQAKDAFNTNMTQDNAYAFYYLYNILYNLRYKGEQSYLAMTKVKGISSLFSDFGYSLKKEVVNDTLNTLETKCRFTFDGAKSVMSYAQYASKMVVHCPVNVEVFDPQGNLIVTLEDQVESDVTNEHGRFAVVHDAYSGDFTKVICLNDEGDYRFRILSQKAGLVSVEFAASDSEEVFEISHLEMDQGDILETSVTEMGETSSATLNDSETVEFESQKSDRIPVESISLEVENIEMKINDQRLLKPLINPETVSEAGVYWYSDHPEIADVQNGNITAKATGTANIFVVSIDNPEAYQSVSVLVSDPDPDQDPKPEIDTDLLERAIAEGERVLKNKEAYSSNESTLESLIRDGDELINNSQSQTEVIEYAKRINNELLQWRLKPSIQLLNKFEK